MQKKREENGITLIALIVTIIILLILAGITVAALTGDNGLIQNAGNAKEQTEIANEKEILEQAAIVAMGKNKRGNILKTNLDSELDKNPGNGNYSSKDIDEGIEVTFKSSRRYIVDGDGNVIFIKSPEPEPQKSTENVKTMLYGVIEIEFLSDYSYNVAQSPNKPILRDGMKAVYWAKDSSGEIDKTNPANNTYEITSDNVNFKEANWYEYVAQNQENDGKTSRWANAMTSDGSYYVWIPRYSYRIVYFDTGAHENEYRAGALSEQDALKNNYIVAYSDARGIVDSQGKRPADVTSVTSVSVNDKYLRTHPVFDGNVDNGGWDSKLQGIWVMKYEASYISNALKSIPNVASKTGTTMKNMSDWSINAYNKNGQANTILNPHMMKNSEWGAIEYLADSKYGRNGTGISGNQCTDKITGAGRGLGNNQIKNSKYSVNSETNLPEPEQQYNGTIGQLSSTTGNIYGIYDMVGGLHEYIMGFGKDENNSIMFGRTGFTNETIPEKKYYQTYSKIDGTILGDGLYETQWGFKNLSFSSTDPIIWRGSWHSSISTIFYSGNYHGGLNYGAGFRACLTVK